ncbi:MAG: hypothetical protein ACFFBP_01625 [Promethearchaeota archaeon]
MTEYNFYDTLIDQNLNLEQISSLNEGDYKKQKQNLTLASKLYSILLNHEELNEPFNNISKLIILILSVPQIKISSNMLMENNQRLFNEILYEFDGILKMDYGCSVNKYFEMLEKIPYILKELSDLTNKQKLDYCNIERLLMRLYIKNINERVNIRT